MNSKALFVVPLVVLCVQFAGGQQQSSTATQKTTTTPTAAAPMTPREMAELRGDIQMAEKNYAGGVRIYEGILRSDREDGPLLNKIGVGYEQLEDFHAAEHYFKRSMKADKTFVSPINNLGTIEYAKKNYGKAIRYYKKAVKLRDDLGAVYSNLGYAYFGKKEYALAIDAFQRAIAVDPEVFAQHGSSGSILQQRTTTDPGLFYFIVAKTYAEGGDAEDAAHYLKLARDAEYQQFLSAETDPAFAKVIKDPRVQEVLVVPPSYERNRKMVQN
ncbi:MAG TPA: tetratricopeptide repeat protein [Verrucomicrobiae bacterium]|nr:tetratricopeptide repeat protein [Verrucomicrobiae bacterium]